MPDELHLKVFLDRSELVHTDGVRETFFEGVVDSATKLRYKRLVIAFEQGFLNEQIELCRDKPDALEMDRLSDAHAQLLDALVNSMTSEVGRALIGLSILQLCVKSIEPTQSIRLHKGGSSARDFSWREGVSMRALDNRFITPALRHYDLLKLNNDGFMMTRSLAENYPYSKVYKANMRGARSEWTAMVEAIEAGEVQPKAGLQYLLSKLLNNASQFNILASNTLGLLKKAQESGKLKDKTSVAALLKQHINGSNYAARIMEITMHSLMQALQEAGGLGSGTIVPLSQMRSANKKHGNIGDIEVLEGGEIVEAWDAKYGKSYLRDELEELNDKLAYHDNIGVAGFVTSGLPERLQELDDRRKEIEELHDISLPIMDLDRWIDRQFARSEHGLLFTEEELATKWSTAYAESIAQRRPQIAPIDEPCYQWLDTLQQLLSDRVQPFNHGQ